MPNGCGRGSTSGGPPVPPEVPPDRYADVEDRLLERDLQAERQDDQVDRRELAADQGEPGHEQGRDRERDRERDDPGQALALLFPVQPVEVVHRRGEQARRDQRDLPRPALQHEQAQADERDGDRRGHREDQVVRREGDPDDQDRHEQERARARHGLGDRPGVGGRAVRRLRPASGAQSCCLSSRKKLSFRYRATTTMKASSARESATSRTPALVWPKKSTTSAVSRIP